MVVDGASATDASFRLGLGRCEGGLADTAASVPRVRFYTDLRRYRSWCGAFPGEHRAWKRNQTPRTGRFLAPSSAFGFSLLNDAYGSGSDSMKLGNCKRERNVAGSLAEFSTFSKKKYN